MEPENGSGKHPFYAVGRAKKWPYFEGPVRDPEMMRKMADLGRVLGQKLAPKNGQPGNADKYAAVDAAGNGAGKWNRKMGPENTRFMP